MSLDSRMGEKRNELLADVVSLVERRLAENEVTPVEAALIANDVADLLADQWGGQNISFPKDYLWKLAKVELAIYDKFNGRNFAELAREHGLTERAVRKLIARVRAKLASMGDRRQMDLLAVPDSLGSE